jgi:hypothetical protein
METGEKRGHVEVLRNGPAGEMSATPFVFHHIPQSLLICFKSVLQNVDNVLHLAIAKKVLKKTVEDVDEKFKKAIDELSTYKKEYHTNSKKPVIKRVKTVEDKDKSSLEFFNSLKENWHVREELTPLCYCTANG